MSPSKDRIRAELDDLARLRDEIQLKLHLASMDAKQAWKELEPRLDELDRKVEREGQEIAKATSELVVNLGDAVRKFRDRLVS
jgi:hypothetical protein